MPIGKIKGEMLENNLLRNGVDLAFQTDQIYLNVASKYVGINTSTPFRDLTVSGTTKALDLIVDTKFSNSNIEFTNNQIYNDNGSIVFSPAGPTPTVTMPQLTTDGLKFYNNNIVSTRSNEDIDVTVSGIGNIKLNKDTEVYGNLHATGNVTFDGDIVFGSDNLDNVSFDAAIASNIVPNTHNTFQLGSATKRWNNIFTQKINGVDITTSGLVTGGIDLTKRQGKTWYVATNGSSSNYGDHQQSPFDTIERALAHATDGDAVLIYPGTYTELLPLTIPAGVTVKGLDVRNVIIQPDTASTDKDVFLLNGQTTVEDLTIKNFYYNSVANTGHAFRFANNINVTSRSPYIRNVTVITQGSAISSTDPRGFAAGDAGRGAYIDGSVAASTSNEASMLFHSVTFITPGVDCITMTNGVRVEWLNSFIYFAYRGLYALQGSAGFANLGAVFGAEIRAIGSANVYGTYGAVADGDSTLMYLVSHNFGYIGVGKDSTNDKSASLTDNQAVELNNGRIYYQNLDHKGLFEVGQVFTVDGDTGKISFAPTSFNVSGLSQFTFLSTSHSTVIDAVSLQQDNIIIQDRTILSQAGDINFIPGSGALNLNSNVNVSNNLTVNQNTNLTSVSIGNQTIDTVSFNSTFSSSLIPTNSNSFNLGSTNKYWRNIYAGQYRTDSLEINDNYVQTTVSNANLELRANGTGSVVIDQLNFKSNSISSNATNTDIQITPDGAGSIQLEKNTTVTGTLNVSGITEVTGTTTFGNAATDTVVFNNFIGSNLVPTTDNSYDVGSTNKYWRNIYIGQLLTDNVVVNDNYVSTTVSNSNLELRANGTGSVVIDQLNFKSNLISSNATNADIQINPNGTGTIQLLKDTVVTGNLDVSNSVYITGTTTFGDSVNDSVTFATEINSHLIPTINNNYDVGSNSSRYWRNVYSGQYLLDGLEINDNYIRTTVSNSNFELRSNGTGVVNIDQLGIKSNLISSVTTNTDIQINPNGTGIVQLLKDTAITGSMNVSGDTLVTGNVQLGDQIIDSVNVIGKIASNLLPSASYTYDLGSSSRVWNDIYLGKILVDGLEINDNYIQVVDSNANLDLSANGTGVVAIDQLGFKSNVVSSLTTNTDIQINPNGTGTVQLLKDTVVTGNLNVTGDTNIYSNLILGDAIVDTVNFVGRVNSNLIPSTNYTYDLGSNSLQWNDLYVGKIVVDSLEFNDNYITTTIGNTNLELRANGTGSIEIETLRVNGSTVTPKTSNTDIQINSQTRITGTGAAILPLGSNATRILSTGEVRYNNSTNQFQGQIPGGTRNLYGLSDIDQNTSITAENTIGANDSTIRMYINGVQKVTINSNQVSASPVVVDDVRLSSREIATINTNADLTLDPSGTGSVLFKDLAIRSNTFTDTNSSGARTISSSGTGYVRFTGSGAVAIPYGTTAQQPAGAAVEIGMHRWNTTLSRLEVYDGSAWVSAIGTSAGINADFMMEITDVYALIFG